VTARFRWFPDKGLRHAVKNALQPSEEGRTLCGIDVVAPCTALPKFPDWCWPECGLCDATWRKAEGLSPRPELPLPRLNGEAKRARTKVKTGVTS
jgi:hypothetical protein